MKTKIDWVTQERKIKDLKEFKSNPRILTKKQAGHLRRSIDKFGLVEIPVINKDGTIIAGHMRIRMLKEKHGDDFQIPVRCPLQQLTDKEAREYLIRSNKNTGEWDHDVLANEFEEEDLSEWGFEEEDFGRFDSFEEMEETEGDDDVPESAPPITVLGDLYDLGDHRVLCGDSTMIDEVEKLMEGVKADMVYTDPPYGMSLDVDYDKMFKDKDHKNKGDRFDKVIADDKYFDPKDILSVTNDIKEVWLWGADYFYDSLPRGGSMCSWDKRTESLDKVVGNTTEFLWSKTPHRRMTARVLWSGHHGMGKDDDKKRIHPTQKPITLHDWFFENFGNNKNTILDLFLGSGSTLIACEKTNRKCYGMELDPKYCDVIVKRYIEFCKKNNRKFSVKRNGKDCLMEFKN